MNILLLVSTVFLFFSGIVFSQVQSNVLLEHFTNTNCSVCGSRNPGLFSNLEQNNSDIIHVSFYPSRPYADCKLNNHNSKENDDRAKFYGLFGSTPQIVIQGVVPNRPNFNDASLFNDFRDKRNPYSLTNYFEITEDSIKTKVVIESPIKTNWDSLNLVVLSVEDTVFYQGRNAEKEHYNVFRSSFTGIQGMSASRTVNIGDSAVFYYSIPTSSDLDFDRVYTIAFLQNPYTKEVLQVVKGKSSRVKSPVSLSEGNTEVFIYPSLTSSLINVKGVESFEFEVYDLNGKKVAAGSNVGSAIDVTNLENGMYLLYIVKGTRPHQLKFIKTNN